MRKAFLIDYRKLYDLGYRGILLDIDNTLIPHGMDSTPEVDALLKDIQATGLKVILFSDNDNERIAPFLKNIDAPYLSEAGKPHPAGYLRARDLLGVAIDHAICIGDQVFLDIFGANRCGMSSIPVRFIHPAGDRKISKRRRAEQLILLTYRARKKQVHHGFLWHNSKQGFVGMMRTPQRGSVSRYRLPTDERDRHTSGEVFSFWRLVGKVTKQKGYQNGRVLVGSKLQPGRGGGLCNLVNTIHLLMLHESPSQTHHSGGGPLYGTGGPGRCCDCCGLWL